MKCIKLIWRRNFIVHLRLPPTNVNKSVLS
jgi:hypothetical protein